MTVKLLRKQGKSFKEVVSTDIVELGQAGTRRIIASGKNVTVGASSTVTLATVTRNAGEILIPAYFLNSNNNGDNFGENGGLFTVYFFFERTGNANEFRYRVANTNLLSSRNIDWGIEGIGV